MNTNIKQLFLFIKSNELITCIHFFNIITLWITANKLLILLILIILIFNIAPLTELNIISKYIFRTEGTWWIRTRIFFIWLLFFTWLFKTTLFTFSSYFRIVNSFDIIIIITVSHLVLSCTWNWQIIWLMFATKTVNKWLLRCL